MVGAMSSKPGRGRDPSSGNACASSGVKVLANRRIAAAATRRPRFEGFQAGHARDMNRNPIG